MTYLTETKLAVKLNRAYVRSNIIAIRRARKWGGDTTGYERCLARNLKMYRDMFHRQVRDEKTIAGIANAVIKPLGMGSRRNPSEHSHRPRL